LTWVRFGGTGWLLGGNDGITISDFIGSINDADVVFRRFSAEAGRLNSFNTSFGVGALSNVNPIPIGPFPSGIDNVAIGVNALSANIGGVKNIAIGNNALENLNPNSSNGFVGQANIAIGFNTLTAGVPGNDNIAIGQEAAKDNTGNLLIAIGKRAGTSNNAPNNIAIGESALTSHLSDASTRNIAIGPFAMTGGSNNSNTVSQNVAIGFRAGESFTSINNVAIGDGAMQQTSGEGNVGIGSGVMNQSNTSFNTGVGYQALFTASGSGNIAIGYFAGRNKGAGTNCVIIGRDANAPGHSNAIAIGYQAATTADNQIRLGNSAISSVITSGVVTAPRYIATDSGTTYADYVFEDYFNGISKIKSDYKFNTLESAEAFVIKNGHLPGVKSYAEVMENGFKLDLTNATITNLEKLEEQFLYITELNKKIKTQDAIINEQDEKIKSLETRLERIEKLLEN
jgi:hypothetical protein